MPRCPSCGYEGDLSSFTQLREPWKYNFYTVYRLRCPVCSIILNYYVGVSPKGKKSSFSFKVGSRSKK
ncbi:MAG: hypothetical protein DJ555_00780 [Desulfurococcaceae archaeon]|nr:MAG: hypothetical protein DJ555_00780 [Desulfurococcaceae archaeon]